MATRRYRRGRLLAGGLTGGTGTAGPAIWRPSTGPWAIRAIREWQFGEPGAIAVPAGYKGDATTEPAVCPRY
ncbi:hypothetical protein ABT297_05335 [Dactylosporangium sp. NPDC000555]|uniref:hypothetical protein n=1 Tax=Dactylosporangium sp. NPDC000555 TaxID=3154260 RepID=UPI00331F002C